MGKYKFILGYASGVAVAAVTAFADWTPSNLSSFEELDTLVADKYASLTNDACIIPPFFSFCLSAGFFTFAPEDEIAAVTNLFDAGHLLGVPVWKIRVTETQTTERIWLLYGGIATEAFRTNAVPAGFDPDQWVEQVYGKKPDWIKGDKIDQWYRWRDRSRMHLGMTLMVSNDWPLFLEAIRIASTNIPAPQTPPPTLPADTNRLSFVGIEHRDTQTIRLWLYSPSDHAPFDLFGSNVLPPPANRWSLLGSAPAGEPFSVWDQPVNSGSAFFHAARNDIDSDGDGIPDGRELLAFGTRPDTRDTDGDGISDRDELYRYGTNPNAIDSDGDGIPDGEEIASGLNPNAADTDLDGLTDFEELYVYFTDPFEPDSDGDGLSDGDEILIHHSSPFSNDTDDDRVDDKTEVDAGMSPLLVDSDNDGIDDYSETYTYNFLSATDASDAEADHDGDGFNNFVEFLDNWSLTTAAYTNASPYLRFITRAPGLNNRRLIVGRGSLMNCMVLGDAEEASALLRIPLSKQLAATMQKRLYHSGTAGFYLNGIPLASYSSPTVVSDSDGPVDYRMTALPSAQGTTAQVWLTDDQGQNSTMHVNCRMPKITKISVLAEQSANFKDILNGQTGDLFVPWEPGRHETTHVHVKPFYDNEGYTDCPKLNSRSYSLVRVSGVATNYTANMNINDYRSTRENRRGLPLPVGHHLLAAGLDLNLDGEIADEEASLACDVFVVKVDLGIKRRNGDIVLDAIEQSSGSVLQLTALTNSLNSYLSLTGPTVEPPDALNRLTYKFKTWTPTYCHGAIRLYRNGVLFMNAGAAETNVAPSALSATWTLDATVGGIVDLSLVAYDPSGREVTRDTVRINAIPCEPADGRILYVRPDSTTPTPPYDSFDKHAAHKIGDALRVMEQGDNVLVSPYGLNYNEYDLPITKGGVIAGLGGHWTIADPFTNASPKAALFDYSELPTIVPGVSDYARAIFKVDGVNAAVTLSGFRLCSGRATLAPGEGGAVYASETANPVCISYVYFSDNRASDYGGAVSLNRQSAALLDTCKFLNNLCEYDDQGEVRFTHGMGGAVASFFSALTVTNCMFNGNTARTVRNTSYPTIGSAGGGGDIYLRHGNLVLVSSASESATAGIEVPVQTKPNSDYFTGDGGSLLVHGTVNDTFLTISSCMFSLSKAYGNGGAISISRDSSPEGRAYFVKSTEWLLDWPCWQPEAEPDALGGGCTALFANVLFEECKAGWQGGTISANGRQVALAITDCVFTNGYAGLIHRSDGKGGAVAVCGGIQQARDPQNHVLVKGAHICGCTATGNGGGLYVTIRGLLELSATTVTNCSAQNAGTSLSGGNDFRMVEGMGGGLHISAGGMAVISAGPEGRPTYIVGNKGWENGGGVSVKSGRLTVSGAARIDGNRALGDEDNGFGNGGGLFVSTSYYDDIFIFNQSTATNSSFFGAGSLAAFFYNEHGYLSASEGTVTLRSNLANRWGGGLYVGLPPPWWVGFWPENYAESKVWLLGAQIENNVALTGEAYSTLRPAQVVSERVDKSGTSSSLTIDNSSVSGNPTSDIGVYVRNSLWPSTNGVAFSSLATNILENL